MGYLIHFRKNQGAFQAVWEAFEIASKPRGAEEWRTAVAIEDVLLSVSTDALQEAIIECPQCHHRTPFRDSIHYEFWRVERLRKLIDDAQAIFLEDSAFRYLKTIVLSVQPPQPRVRDFVALLDIIEDSEKNWKGSELDLRVRTPV